MKSKQFINVLMILKISIIQPLNQDDALKLMKSEPQFKKESQLTTVYRLESMTYLIYSTLMPGKMIVIPN